MGQHYPNMLEMAVAVFQGRQADCQQKVRQCQGLGRLSGRNDSVER